MWRTQSDTVSNLLIGNGKLCTLNPTTDCNHSFAAQEGALKSFSCNKAFGVSIRKKLPCHPNADLLVTMKTQWLKWCFLVAVLRSNPGSVFNSEDLFCLKIPARSCKPFSESYQKGCRAASFRGSNKSQFCSFASNNFKQVSSRENSFSTLNKHTNQNKSTRDTGI